jgi:peptidylprolyl isomerase
MARRTWQGIAASGLLVGLASLANADSVVGSAGGIEVSKADVEKILANLPASARAAVQANPSTLTQAVRGELVRRMMLVDANRAKFDHDPAIQSDLARLRDEVVLRQWVAHQSEVPADYPSSTELDKAYQALVARASSISEVRLSQIFVAAPDGMDANALSTALRKVATVQSALSAPNADFAKIAVANSEHKDSAANGGNLEFEVETQLIPEIRAAIKAMKPGDAPVLVKSNQGFHIVRLVERRPAKILPLAAVREALVAELRKARAEELERRYVTELTTKNPPAINEVELAKMLPKDSKL